MKTKFYKYQGAGNDFILINDRKEFFPNSQTVINRLCDRHFGIGADGLILLHEDEKHDFKMVYFNSDGNESSMCGNGGRCIILFAYDLKIIDDKTTFSATDGLHEGKVNQADIELKMTDVQSVQKNDGYFFLNTGSPHHVEFVEDVSKVNVKERGSKIRYGAPYFEEGSNVNFVELTSSNSLKIRTYERGVEDETLACGTGVTAAAIAAFESGRVKTNEVFVEALGGKLSVKFQKNGNVYSNVWLSGPAKKVFSGEIEI